MVPGTLMRVFQRFRFNLLRLFVSPRSPLHSPRLVQLLVPKDFNESAYMYLHADVRNSVMSASQHFLLHGRGEGRNYNQVFSEVPVLVNPIPGVNLSHYHFAAGLAGQDSTLSHFLLAGQPTGPWTVPVIRRAQEKAVSISPFVVVHFHCFHLELLDEFLALAETALKERTNKLVVTYSDDQITGQILERLGESSVNHEVVRVSNHGRNLGALQELLNSPAYAGFEIWAHFHSKKSKHLSEDLVREWRQFLFRSLLGDSSDRAKLKDIVFELFKDEDLGIVFADDPHEFGWGENRGIGREISRSMGFELDDTPPKFPVGAMFVARRAFLARLFSAASPFTDSLTEPFPNDGTAWHAFERLLGVAPQYLGFRAATVRGGADSYAWLRST